MTLKSVHTTTLSCPLLIMAGLVVCLLSSATSAGGSLQPFEVDNPARNFHLPDLRGENHALTDYRGKVVVVNFWASWCPPCIHELPGMQRLQEKLSTRPFVILPVNVGEKKYRVWKFVKLINFTLPVLLDGDKDTFRSWEASVLPTSFLLDRAGRIRYRVQGELEWDNEDVTRLIEALIDEEENMP